MRLLHLLLPLAPLASHVSAAALTAVLAANNASLSTLSTLLATVPDVVTMLSSAQNITILAPSNDAFAKLMARNPNSAQLMQNPRLLTGVLQYHVLSGKIPSGDFSTTPRFASSMLAAPFANVTGGQRVELVKVNNTAMIFSGFKQGSMVSVADVMFDGGVVHVVDTVLTVPATPSDTAADTGLTSLAGALTAAQLVDAVDALSDVTIFAPSNAAFAAIGGGGSAPLSSSTQDVLAGILGYHVVQGVVKFSPDLLQDGSGQVITLGPTVQGGNVTVRREDGQLFVNSARIVLADVLTTNGVVHVIDNVLNPSNTTATPNPSATTQSPAFDGASAVAEAPFTSGISPTTTFVPATVPLNAAGRGGAFAAVPTAAALVLGAAAAAMLV